MLARITQPLQTLLARLFGQLVADADRVPRLAQTAGQRAVLDVSGLAKRSPIIFGAVTVATGAAGGALATALVSSKATLVVHIAAPVAGTVAGFLLPVAVMFLTLWLTAPTRQRDDARAELGRLAEPIDVAALADEFDAWASARRAATPRYGGRWMNPMFQPESPLAAVYQQQDTQLANIAATTRAECHARFRDPVRVVLGADVEDPQTLPDVEKIAQRLRAAGDEARRRELLAEHAGTLVGGQHLALLEGSIDAGLLAVLNEREVTFGDDPGGAQHNREAFTEHFPALAAALATWQAAVEAREQCIASAAALVPREVAAHNIGAPRFIPDAVVECFIEHLGPMLRLRKEPLDAPWVRLRCVQDGVGAFRGSVDAPLLDPERWWSAYLHSGLKEYKVAEFENRATEFTEEGTVELQEFVAELEAELRECFDAITSANQIFQVKGA